jgi:CRP-like cAMP-binding protein
MMPPPPLPLEPVPMPFEEPPAPPPPRSRPAVAQPRRAPAARHAEPGRAADEAITPVQAAKEREASRFFSDFPRAALEELLSTTSIRSFGPQQVIVREGEPGTSLFLIEEGIVVVFTSGPDQLPLRLAEIGPGEFFGEVAVLTGRPRTATIIAQTPVTALEISSEDLHRLAIRHPEVHQILRRFYERRAQATVEAVLARIRGQRE